MYKHTLDTSIEYLKGVGPDRSALLKTELNIHTFRDLLYHFPFRYIDRTKIIKIKDLRADQGFVQIKGKIDFIETNGEKFNSRLTVHFSDDSGRIILAWFKGVKWMKSILKEKTSYLVFGRISDYKGKPYLAHPEMEEITSFNEINKALQPVYSTTEKLTYKNLPSKGIYKLVQTLLGSIENNIEETLSKDLLHHWKLMDKAHAIHQIHNPTNYEDLKKAQFRLKFEELLFLQLQLLQTKQSREKKTIGFSFSKVGDYLNTFYKEFLPFELTGAQKRVIKEIRKDLGSGIQMNRLLQGDVGSGKTMVALMAMLIALDNGFQAVIMAPTEILAQQHYATFKEYFSKLGVEVALLTGSTKAVDRKKNLPMLASGELKIAIGTHALIEDKVVFNNLGLVVIDEQHKFGVAQRAKLWEKNKAGAPHILVMTATPIPRTLALTFYGDLDTSVIDELPPGRKPIKTIHQFEKNRLKVWGFLKEEIGKGRQVYIVFPLIKESETLDYQNLMSGYEALLRYFPLPTYKIGVIHGQMKPADKDLEMQKFAKGQTHILISTTVIEVGVNVPNACIMVIESAEKFGLSQLHQLRGRVGRGADQSFCFLMTSYKLSADAKVRLDTMVKTNDGFEIAETDLKLRGPGDIMGTQQSGVVDLKIANLAQDGQIVAMTRDAAKSILQADPALIQPDHQVLKQELLRIILAHKNWMKIS